MNTEHLRYFAIIAHCGSIGKACDQLQLKQQYLSGVIKSLEQQLNTTLFTRHSRGVTLTDDGQYLLEKVEQIVHLTDELQLDYLYPSKAVYKNAINDITLYIIPHFSTHIFGNLLEDYRHYFPKVSITISENSRAEILTAVADNHAAMGLTVITTDLATFQQNLPPDLQAIYYRTVDIVALTDSYIPVTFSYSHNKMTVN